MTSSREWKGVKTFARGGWWLRCRVVIDAAARGRRKEMKKKKKSPKSIYQFRAAGRRRVCLGIHSHRLIRRSLSTSHPPRRRSLYAGKRQKISRIMKSETEKLEAETKYSVLIVRRRGG